jgi:hypothetical protein
MQKPKLVYLACPFRHKDISIQKKRCAAAHYVAAQLSSQGYHVFSPLTHNEILIDLIPNQPKEHWLEFDLAILEICKKLLVLKLEGWDVSYGVKLEIDFAKDKKIPIEEIDPPEEEKYLSLVRIFQ